MLKNSKNTVIFGLVGTVGAILLLGTTGISLAYVQSAYAVGDVSENSATEYAPGIVKDLQKETSASSLAPRAYDDPNEIGDPNLIGDPNERAPGLLNQGDIFPGPR